MAPSYRTRSAELVAIAESGKPSQNIVAGRLRKRRLVESDSNGTWWLTDSGKALMTPA
jgi:hypothetical protein